MQARLSRALESEAVSQAGGEGQWDALDVQIVVGTPSDPLHRTPSESRREEVFYRLNVVHVMLPRPRGRLGDLPADLRDCLKAYAERSRIEVPEVSSDLLAELKRYGSHANKSEREHVARLLLRRGTRTMPRGFPPEFSQP